MKESQMSGGLCMHWLPVSDPTGRTHMEAVWVAATAPSALRTAPEAAMPAPHTTHAA